MADFVLFAWIMLSGACGIAYLGYARLECRLLDIEKQIDLLDIKVQKILDMPRPPKIEALRSLEEEDVS